MLSEEWVGLIAAAEELVFVRWGSGFDFAVVWVWLAADVVEVAVCGSPLGWTVLVDVEAPDDCFDEA